MVEVASNASISGTRRRGTTLIEVTIAMAILGAVVAMIFLILQSSSDSYANQSIRLDLDARARDVVATIARDVRAAGADTMSTGDPAGPVTAGTTYHDLRFGTCSGYDLRTKSVQFADTVRYRWVSDLTDPVNNRDDDSDGLVDEGCIERTDPRGVTTRICDYVKFEGLDLVFDGKTVSISVELQQRDGKYHLIERKAEVTSALRNVEP